MTPFSLKIITPDGVQFEGMAEEVVVRTTTGDVGILAGHINFVSSLGMGEAMIRLDGKKCYGACMGGMISVLNGAVSLLPITFEWSDKIDAERANASKLRAEAVLQNKDASLTEVKLAKARLKRALVRSSVANRK